MSRPKTDQRMIRVSTWITKEEQQKLDQLKDDVSRSLFIRRAVKRAIIENENVPSGQQVSHHSPQTAAPEVFATSTPTPQEFTKEVIEAV